VTKELKGLTRGTCKTCKHFDRNETESAQGLCRERSPQVSALVLPHTNQLTGQVSMLPQVVANFPQVGDDCWCGQYTAKWATAMQ
jgi:hypothetical protein